MPFICIESEVWRHLIKIAACSGNIFLNNFLIYRKLRDQKYRVLFIMSDLLCRSVWFVAKKTSVLSVSWVEDISSKQIALSLQTNKEICLWKDTRWFVQRTSQTYFEGVKIFLFEILFLLNKNTCKLIYVTQTTKQNIFQIF